MEKLRRSFRLDRRSKSSRLAMESVSLECAAVTGYKRLSQSMRFADKPELQWRSKALRSFCKVFSRKDHSNVKKFSINKKTKEKKKLPKKNICIYEIAFRIPSILCSYVVIYVFIWRINWEVFSLYIAE